MMGLFEFSGAVLNSQDARNMVRQYSWEDLRPYTRSPEEEYKYSQDMRQYRMFPEASLDERFADFKIRLVAAIDRRKR